MKGRKYLLTPLADADIQDILANTVREFGDLQFERYWELIDKAAQMVGDEPMRPSSKARDDLGVAVRSFHIEVAAGRRGAASHIFYYLPGMMDDGTQSAVILRVLWDGMEARPLVENGMKDLA